MAHGRGHMTVSDALSSRVDAAGAMRACLLPLSARYMRPSESDRTTRLHQPLRRVLEQLWNNCYVK